MSFIPPLYFGSALPSSPGNVPGVLIPGDGRDPTQDPAWIAELASEFESPLVVGRVFGSDPDDL